MFIKYQLFLLFLYWYLMVHLVFLNHCAHIHYISRTKIPFISVIVVLVLDGTNNLFLLHIDLLLYSRMILRPWYLFLHRNFHGVGLRQIFGPTAYFPPRYLSPHHRAHCYNWNPFVVILDTAVFKYYKKLFHILLKCAWF